MRMNALTLCSTGNFLAHHLAFFALGLVIFGLVMLDGRPLAVPG